MRSGPIRSDPNDPDSRCQLATRPEDEGDNITYIQPIWLIKGLLNYRLLLKCCYPILLKCRYPVTDACVLY